MSDLLFLAHRIPYPPDRGDKIRSWNVLRHLAGLGRVHLACFADDAADTANLAALRSALGPRLGEAFVEPRRSGLASAAARSLVKGQPVSLASFDSKAMRHFVAGLLSRQSIHAIYAFSSQMAQFVPAGATPRFVMDFVDMDSAKFAEYAAASGPPMRWIYAREAAGLLAHEQATAARAATALFVSDAEANLFRSAATLPGGDIRVIENGIDLEYYDSKLGCSALPGDSAGDGPLLLFTGQMDYRPNVEAVIGFAERALPLLRRQCPSARFVIVGRNPARKVRRLARLPGVHVAGQVPDVRPWIAAADIVVAPLAIARGIQNKLLEAMAMARPVIATSAAFRGIDAEPGRDLVIADTAIEQANAALRLIADPAEAGRIGAAARSRMESRYRWAMKLAPLADILGVDSRQVAA